MSDIPHSFEDFDFDADPEVAPSLREEQLERRERNRRQTEIRRRMEDRLERRRLAEELGMLLSDDLSFGESLR